MRKLCKNSFSYSWRDARSSKKQWKKSHEPTVDNVDVTDVDIHWKWEKGFFEGELLSRKNKLNWKQQIEDSNKLTSKDKRQPIFKHLVLDDHKKIFIDFKLHIKYTIKML